MIPLYAVQKQKNKQYVIRGAYIGYISIKQSKRHYHKSKYGRNPGVGFEGGRGNDMFR